MDYDWGDIRAEASDHFGSTPGDDLEQRIINVFRANPKLVVDTIGDVGRRFDRGVVNSPWPMVAKIVENEMRRELTAYGIVASDVNARASVVARAERFVRRSGYVYQTTDEIMEELFGERGLLHRFADDRELVARMIGVWAEVRPIGEQLEYESERRAMKFREIGGHK
jgi:hypothetical protein